MKKIICALLACTLCASVSVGLSGCGCSDNTQEQQPGYVVTATEPDLKSDEFGFFIINKDQVMLTEYLGTAKDVKIPESYENYKVTVIGHSVFSRKGITSVEIPDTVREIQDYAFASNRELKSVKLPSSLKIIGVNAFFSCTALESIELPESLEEIGVYAFCGSGLKSVEIPKSTTLTKLDRYVFYQCPDLKEVHMPSTITNIADDTFNECPDDMVMYAPSGSYSQNYAKTHDIEFKESK